MCVHMIQHPYSRYLTYSMHLLPSSETPVLHLPWWYPVTPPPAPESFCWQNPMQFHPNKPGRWHIALVILILGHTKAGALLSMVSFVIFTLVINPFRLLLNPPQILKTRVHLKFWKISDWPIWFLIDPLFRKQFKNKATICRFCPLIIKTS